MTGYLSVSLSLSISLCLSFGLSLTGTISLPLSLSLSLSSYISSHPLLSRWPLTAFGLIQPQRSWRDVSMRRALVTALEGVEQYGKQRNVVVRNIVKLRAGDTFKQF